MKRSDRRLAQRFNLSTPLYVRVWKSNTPEWKFDSVNLSESGVYFETDAPLDEGAEVQLRLDMPMEITGDATAEWLCTGKIVRVQPVDSSGAAWGVGVRFDYYEVSG